MRYSILIIAFLMFNFTGYSQTISGQEDRAYWVNMLSQIADPLLNNMSKGELKKNMPIETISGMPLSLIHIYPEVETSALDVDHYVAPAVAADENYVYFINFTRDRTKKTVDLSLIHICTINDRKV